MLLSLILYALAIGLVSFLCYACWLGREQYFSRAADTEKYITFHDAALKAKYSKRTIPMETLIEAYFDERVDFKGEDIFEVLSHRDEFVNYALTWSHYQFLLQKFLPEVLIHSKQDDMRMVRWHYDRGDDFFNWFLGTSMVYTCAYFKDAEGSEGLEQGQINKLNLVCEKMMMKEGETHLDVGCGWGTMVLHAAKHFGTDSTGITLSENQTAFGNKRIAQEGVPERSRLECMDYRDIPNKVWDKITCLEMAEHVGVKNFQKFCKQMYGLLADDGIFFMQICGLRRTWSWRDIVWGLFMNKYIFPGADASPPLGFTVDHLERAGFEIHSCENLSWHYSVTIYLWYKNWQQNKDLIIKKYGERWYRIWAMFLAWSVLIARDGTADLYQVVARKNILKLDRAQFVGKKNTLSDRMVI